MSASENDFSGLEYSIERVARLIPRIDEWLVLNGDQIDSDRDTALADAMTNLLLHLDRLQGYPVDPSRASFNAEGLALRLLHWVDVTPNDVDGAAHVGAALAVMAADPDQVLAVARLHWQAERDGDDITEGEPLDPSLFTTG